MPAGPRSTWCLIPSKFSLINHQRWDSYRANHIYCFLLNIYDLQQAFTQHLPWPLRTVYVLLSMLFIMKCCRNKISSVHLIVLKHLLFYYFQRTKFSAIELRNLKSLVYCLHKAKPSKLQNGCRILLGEPSSKLN